ncbi:CBM9 family sugar-binding protein [Psychroserpens algicola]|uniref:CBM9 family sugar-binding protein n=1 Tax=Psychroserpens algicola TaxID=1719034 RepID=A0ABT0H635_9FLAO|nr:CBM9 family sugar-binding protein [Psychroserpens algicola]MCK8479484.1 CBM9 family sugar-binding protein [Psychroserpens algicola]
MLLLLILVHLSSCGINSNHKKITSLKPENQLIKVRQSRSPIVIDALMNENVWTDAIWHPINQLWLGQPYTDKDFYGRYKLAWTEEALYLLAEITDDVLFDKEDNPLVAWWDDDCLEIFVDEDNSGGNHQYTHNAFAYHVALDGNVVDMSTSKEGKLYNTHIDSERKTNGQTTVWEVKISLYADTYEDDGNNVPVTLNRAKKIGFALAYCDNDGSSNRENFIGSIPVNGEDKNRGWIDSNIFGTLLLIK